MPASDHDLPRRESRDKILRRRVPIFEDDLSISVRWDRARTNDELCSGPYHSADVPGYGVWLENARYTNLDPHLRND
jgi:hypothetical protein